VAGLTGTVSKVTVTIPSISHSFPNDVDMLLVGPGGQKYVFFSDVIGGTDWANINYTLDDAAAALIPSSASPTSGTFKPTNYVAGDAFPAPAPATPYTNAATAGTDTFASVFNGTNPNGTWSLYVVDDGTADTGQMANGWTINITTPPVCNTQSCSLVCPADVTVQSPTPTVVNYSPATPTGACGVLNYSTPSGSTFPVGATPVTVTGANAAQCTFNVNVVSPVRPLIINEFRLRGPGGANDEYVELYNNSDSPINVSAVDASAGWALAAADGVVRFVIPNGTVIPARAHYLGVNSNGYSLGNYPNGNAPISGDPKRTPGRSTTRNDGDIAEALGIPLNSDDSFAVNGPTASGDVSYTTDIPDNAGIALFITANPANFTLANRLDAVGSTSEANTLYREGAGYAPLSGATYTGGINYAFVRDMCGKGGSMTTNGACTQLGIPKDSNDNATDFVFVDSSGFSVGAGQRLGAPGPENSSAPLTRNSLVAALLDGAVGSSSAPNRVRSFAGVPNGTFGTLDIRRTFSNNTGGNITRLRFRVIDVTTFPAAATWADLRVITSSDVTVSTTAGNVLVRGTTLETPPTQGAGGGFNSSMSVGTVTLATPLANGASINVRWVLGIQQAGTFRFIVNIEALP
jgi:subtilisin-like proprotein convertase family protein